MATYGTYIPDRDAYQLTDAPIDETSKLVNAVFVKQSVIYLKGLGYTFFIGKILNPTGVNKNYSITAFTDGTYTVQLATIMFRYTQPDPPVDVGI